MNNFLSAQEAKTLLDHWEKNNYNSFNIWI